MQNSLGSLSTSSFFCFKLKADFLRVIAAGGGETGEAGGLGMPGDEGEKLKVRREPEGDVPVRLGEGRGGEGEKRLVGETRGALMRCWWRRLEG